MYDDVPEEVEVEVPEDQLTPAQQALADRDWKQTQQIWRKLVEDYGFVLIRLQPCSKQPAESRWRNKIRPKQYNEVGLKHYMNAGIVCGKGSMLIALDVDDPIEFEKLGYEVPKTFMVKTGKGYHYYYILTVSDSIYRNRRKDSFDIRAEMGYVVAPGSIHPDGHVYELINDVEPVAAPEWLLELSKETDQETAFKNRRAGLVCSAMGDLEEVDLNKLSISPHIQKLITEGAPDGADRSQVDFTVVIALMNAGCSDSQIMRVFTDYPICEKSD